MNTAQAHINIILNRTNYLKRRNSYLEIELNVDNAETRLANDAHIRLVNYCMMALFSSIKHEPSGGRTMS